MSVTRNAYQIENMGNRKAELAEHFLELSARDRRARFMYTLDDNGVKEYIDKIGSAGDRVFGAFTPCETEKKFALAGVLHLSFDDKVAEVAMSVNSVFRRQGCGSALMNYAISYAKDLGYSQLKVVCFSQNDSMLGLAEKTGFVMQLDDCSQYTGYLKLN